MEDEQQNSKEVDITFIPNQSTILQLKENKLVDDIPVRAHDPSLISIRDTM